MHMALSGCGPLIALQTVATVKIFAYVVTDIVANQESTSGMLVHEFTYVEYQIIQ